MAAFSAGQSTILPSIDDDSGEEESSNTICDTRDDLIQPLLVVIDEAEGHVSNIEDCVRTSRGIACNRLINNQTNSNAGNAGGGGGWVIGSNKNKKYITYPLPKNTIVNSSPNTLDKACVLNKSRGNVVSEITDNVSLCNETQVSGDGSIPTNVSICNGDQSLGNNETQVSGNKQLNADKPAIFVRSNSASNVEVNKNVVQIGKEKSTVNKIICNNETKLSNSNHHERNFISNQPGFFGNVPSPPPKLPLRTNSGWDYEENSCSNISEDESQNRDICQRNYLLPVGSVDPLRGKVIFNERRNFAIFEKYERESDLFSVIKCTYTVCIRPKWNVDESLFKLFMRFLDLVNARIHTEYENLCDVSYTNIKISNTIDIRYECLSKFQKFDRSVLSTLIDDVSTQVQSSNLFHFEDLIVTVKFVREPSGHGGLDSYSMNVTADPIISSLVNIHLTENHDCLFRSIAYYTLYNERINLAHKNIKKNQITDRAWRLSRKCGMPLSIDASPRLLEQIACTLGV
ncbi:unnamed protein product, partial [Rotaria magnacalcarata]